MKAVQVYAFGGADQLRYEDVPEPVPGPDEVLIRVHACGISRSDLGIRANNIGKTGGVYGLPFIPGKEVAGDIVALGSDVTTLGVGDRVTAHRFPCGRCEWCTNGRSNLCPHRGLLGVTRPGGYAQYVTVPAVGALPLHWNTSYAAGAVTKVTFGTAWHALVNRAVLQSSDTLLVIGAAGGVGNAATQIGRLREARVIAAVGSDRAVTELGEQGLEDVVQYSREELSERVLAMTSQQGVDVIVDAVGGPLLPVAMSALKRAGRLVTVGSHAGNPVEVDMLDVHRRELTIFGSLTANLDEYRTVMDLVADELLTPRIDSVFDLVDVGAAHERMAERRHFGAIALRPN